MKVFFGCATSKLEEYKDIYLAICKHIKDSGHILTRDWVELAIKLYRQGKRNLDREDYYTKTVQAILSADVVILEGTVTSLSLGHQLTLSLEKRKPVLYLVNKNVQVKKTFKNRYIDGIKSSLLHKVAYEPNQLPMIIDDYLLSYKDGLSIRFNLVLNNDLDNYLDWATFTYKVNKSEFIRETIKERMESDERYSKYKKK